MSPTKVVLITGCSSGIGFETALRFARAGEHVFAGVRNLKSEGSEKLKSVAELEHLTLDLVLLDVTNEKQILTAVQHVIAVAGRVDVLVNNAGFGFNGAVEEFLIDEIKEQYETNIFGVLRMIKAVAPQMREQHSGLIINLSSINGVISFPLYGVYSSSKFALETLSETMRFEMKPFGITVTLVEPGVFKTSFVQNRKLPAHLSDPDSPYAPLTTHFLHKANQFDQSKSEGWLAPLMHPSRVANKIYDIAHTKHPKIRYRVGVDAEIVYWLKKILPEWLRVIMLEHVYQWR